MDVVGSRVVRPEGIVFVPGKVATWRGFDDRSVNVNIEYRLDLTRKQNADNHSSALAQTALDFLDRERLFTVGSEC
jgi:hypothetical protein